MATRSHTVPADRDQLDLILERSPGLHRVRSRHPQEDPAFITDFIKANTTLLSGIIQFIISAGTLTYALLIYLHQVVRLVFGQPWHQILVNEILDTWEKELLGDEIEIPQEARYSGASTPRPSGPTRTTHVTHPEPPTAAPSSSQPIDLTQAQEVGEDSSIRHTQQNRPSSQSSPRTIPRRSTRNRGTPRSAEPASTLDDVPQVDHAFDFCHRYMNYVDINLKLKDKLLGPLSKRNQKPGSVYVYKLPPNHTVNGGPNSRFIKIGCSKDVQIRMRRTARLCNYSPNRMSTIETLHYFQVEDILKIQLRNVRMNETGGCPVCEQAHDEWFEYDEKKAEDNILLWRDWVAQKPYDERGVLKDQWRAKLAGINGSEESCWEKFVYGESESESEPESDDSDEDEEM